MTTPCGFPGGSDGKESARNSGDPGSVPESGRSPVEGNGYLLLYSCLESSTDRAVAAAPGDIWKGFQGQMSPGFLLEG